LADLFAGRRVSPPGLAPSDDVAAAGLTPALPTFSGAFPVTERTNEDWLQSLGGTGSEGAAVAELREVLRRGLRRALDGRAGADDGLIEDMAQEGVLKVLGGLATFRGDSRFTTWAVTVAVRVAFTELRRARWRDVSLDRLVEDAPARAPTAPPADGPSQDARQAVLAQLHRVLESELTDRQRQALVAELRGMPQAEIAVQMGLTRNALYKLTHDARKNLKRGLEAAGIGEDEVRETFGL
jgi:RNA polymerase sigma-70 factor (ECF subfamily)